VWSSSAGALPAIGHGDRCAGLKLLLHYSDKTAARLLSLNEAQLREARRSLLAAGLIVYESPLYQVLSLEPTSTSEQPVARTGQTLSISAILRQMLETGEAQQQPPSP
jgi:hypothetical protein